MQFVEQPVQWLGQNREPAVILDQLQTWRELFKLGFHLRSGKKLRIHHLGCTRCNRLQRSDHGGTVATIGHARANVYAIKRIVALHAVGQ